MKRNLLTAMMLAIASASFAQNMKVLTVTTLPQMHCENCENKIKGNLRFEKGVKNIETDIDEQKVTITYDADRISSEKIISSFGKFGYQAEQVGEISSAAKPTATTGKKKRKNK